jgi:RNA polymerase sigma factor (sigma-70 family)
MAKDAHSSTGTTLYLLLSDPSHPDAWSNFVDRYGPKIYGWCRRWGLQDADAENVTQEVLTRLVVKIRQYQPDKGSFRGWLKTVTQRIWSDYLASQAKGGRGSGDTAFMQQLQTVAARDDLLQRLEEEFDHELFEAAKTRVQARVNPETWQIFHLLTMEEKSGAEVAKQFDMKVAAVFVAKSRVQKMLQEEIQRLEKEPEQEESS